MTSRARPHLPRTKIRLRSPASGEVTVQDLTATSAAAAQVSVQVEGLKVIWRVEPGLGGVAAMGSGRSVSDVATSTPDPAFPTTPTYSGHAHSPVSSTEQSRAVS